MNNAFKPLTQSSFFSRADLLTGGLATLLSFAVYAWTAAPNVTLLDSGEFLVAAQHFGVPHPTGYPLWTILAWLFQLLPLGNPAWEIALLSGILGALAVGCCASLSSNMLRWIFPNLTAREVFLTSLSWALFFAWSESMWSQAVIAEVYTLHAFVIVLYLGCLYRFIRSPEQENWLVAAFFLLALAFSNHQLTLSLAPLPFLAVLLVRRQIFADLLAAALVTGILFYLLFGILSGEVASLKTAIRWTWLGMGGFLLFCAFRRFRIRWELVAYLPFAVAFGLLPYAYMPFASSTNPPMNWGYARDTDGFYYSLNRSQYGGSLDDQLLRSAGALVGTDSLRAKQEPPATAPWHLGKLEKMHRWSAFFWFQLIASFTIFSILVFLSALLLIRRAPLPQRTWLYLVLISFFLSAFLQPFMDGAEIDRAGWWLQMPYHTYTMLAYALVCAIGTAVLLEKLTERKIRHRTLLLILLLLSTAWPLWKNYDTCSQRDRWFGWEFGHDMLKDLPTNSVVFGGTDPGRFVPTYMILGESTVPARWKRDPLFDRRDLYIITQNALADPFYLRYIRAHYSEDRPPVSGQFEAWLGRDTIYPAQPLVLPTHNEVRELIKTSMEKQNGNSDVHSQVAEWIFEKNKAKHAFFVEESFPMKWSYSRAIPHGLCYQILPDPMEEIPAEIVRKDTGFWQERIAMLMGNPRFLTDFDARRSYSKLRHTTGSLYEYRNMLPEAEAAYRQALILHPSSMESLIPLSRILWDQGKFAEALALWDVALADDVNNDRLFYMRVVASQRQEWEKASTALLQKIAENPQDAKLPQQLIEGYLYVAEEEKADAALNSALKNLATNEDFLRFAMNVRHSQSDTKGTLEIARLLANLKPDDLQIHLAIATLEIKSTNMSAFYEEAKTILRIGGMNGKEALQHDPTFAPFREEPEFQELLKNSFLPPR